MSPRAREQGQATVEFVALLPLLAIVGLVLWQAAVAGQAVWLSAAAARAAARATAVGADADRAARDVLPSRLERGLRVRAGDGGAVTVSVRIPAVFAGGALGATSSSARFVPQS